MVANNATIAADVLSLDPVVTAPLFAGHEKCIAAVMDAVKEHECMDTYTEDELAAILKIAGDLASYECFLKLFEKGCMDFLGIADEK